MRPTDVEWTRVSLVRARTHARRVDAAKLANLARHRLDTQHPETADVTVGRGRGWRPLTPAPETSDGSVARPPPDPQESSITTLLSSSSS